MCNRRWLHSPRRNPQGAATLSCSNTSLTQLAGGRQLYVSRGTGTWGPPVRLFAAPEITLITIEGVEK